MVRDLAGALALAAATALLSGCATIINGTTQRVQIDSAPGGADVSIDDQQHVTTPAEVSLARGQAHKLVFHKSGYQDRTENLTSGMSGWILGNMLAGGVVGMAIDASDGAGRKLSADSINVTLTPAEPPLADVSAIWAPARQAAPDPDAPSAIEPKTRPAAATGRLKGPPLEDFSDDESGYEQPATQLVPSQ